MLMYASVGISELEIPTKKSLVIYISNCQHRCRNCHTPYLHECYGDLLRENFETIFNVYYEYFDVVCFMGEGKETEEDKKEMLDYCTFIHSREKKTALYCGRDCQIENWMEKFNYIKIGSYQEEKGSITKQTTNQKLFKKENNKYVDITYMFWK